MSHSSHPSDVSLHKGGCHCGDVSFEFNANPSLNVTLCNCSLCHMTGYRHVFVPEANLRFIRGQENLALYTFGTHTAQHYFCKTCGIKPLYRPRSHPEAWSVNLRCVKGDTITIAQTIDFDGQNWDKNIEALRKKT